MKTITSKKLPCCCKTEKLFEQLRVAHEGWERSALLLQLIEELNACLLIEDDLFYPWRPTTWSERVVRSEEAVTQRELAKFGLYSVLVDSHMSFEMRLAMIKFLVDGHVRSAQRRMISHEEAGVQDGDLAALGARVTALHRGVPASAAVDFDATSVRRPPLGMGAPGSAGGASYAPPAGLPRAA